MNVGVVIPVFSRIPIALCESITNFTRHTLSWHICLHRSDIHFLQPFLTLCRDLQTNPHVKMVNRGLSRTWNDGIVDTVFSGCDIVIICNDDIIFKPGAFDEFVEHARNAKQYGITTCFGEEDFCGKKTPVCQGFAVFAISIETILTVGFFDENISPAYFEDVDYEFRCNLSGRETYCAQQVLVEHERNGSSKISETIRLLINENKVKNELYMIAKWDIELRDRYIARYKSPFNSGVGNKICFADRLFPYGQGRDRDDLYIFNKTLHDYNVKAYFSGDPHISYNGFVSDGIALISRIGDQSVLYGPYCYMDKGYYELTVLGTWSSVCHSICDIAKNIGEQIKVFDLPEDVEKRCLFNFELEYPASNFEVRLFIDPKDTIRFIGYRLRRIYNL